MTIFINIKRSKRWTMDISTYILAYIYLLKSLCLKSNRLKKREVATQTRDEYGLTFCPKLLSKVSNTKEKKNHNNVECILSGHLGPRPIWLIKNLDNWTNLKNDYGRVSYVTSLHTYFRLSIGNYSRVHISILHMTRNYFSNLFFKFDFIQ